MFEKNNECIWIHGSFNVCIPVLIHCPGLNNAAISLSTKLGLQVPLPYKVGEEAFQWQQRRKGAI
ncbi:hypothetical protein EMCG_04011 [[Emmonsia] crescens]|uniref:Uncharacterized protein n=1 Tax=[Emmonsia] crescens TaxID=73230 RepID=A0A0G2J7Y4_9EURO|nr:hypothetical protein EMCG_04011 [Emmonsia crescens UAMH 3008]